MNYLTLENVTKTYGDKTLFDGITLHIDKGQKVALVAKNGSGKTTLLKVLAGEEASEGEQSHIYIHKEITVGMLRQEPLFDDNHTVLQAILDSDIPMIQAVKAYEEALLFPEREEKLQAALSKMDDLKAWDVEVKIKEILSRFNIEDIHQEIKTLSGGQRKRVALTKILIEEPDFLILDEPTNHLDIDMIEWLEKYLQQPNLTLFMVTHDRYFLDRVCNTIVELDQGILHKYKGNYSDYLEKKAIRTENEAINLDKNKKLFKKELEWMRRQPKARGTKAKSRIDKFYDIKEASHVRQDNDSVQLEFKANRLGKKILELHNVSLSYGNKKIVEKFSYKFQKKERVGIVGPNGAGKSSFIKILAKEIATTGGKVVHGDTLVIGNYKQDGINLAEDKTVLDVVRDIADYIELSDGKKISASQMCERFMFPPKQQRVFVSQLSGGEKRRLYLLTVLVNNPNFLILDEPTNDLDILTLNVLEDFLLEYQGCLVVVTHDRYFMDKLVQHLFVFEGEGVIRDYIGNYSEYREEKQIEEAEAKQLEREEEKARQEKIVTPKETPKLSYEERKEFKRLEKEIDKLEKQKNSISEQFNDASLTGEDIKNLSIELAEIDAQIESKELRWMELAEILENE